MGTALLIFAVVCASIAAAADAAAQRPGLRRTMSALSSNAKLTHTR